MPSIQATHHGDTKRVAYVLQCGDKQYGGWWGKVAQLGDQLQAAVTEKSATWHDM